MHRKSSALLLIILLWIFTPQPVWGVKKLAQTGFKWLSIPTGARATAMGYAFSPIDREVTAGFWNPAGLNDLTGTHFSASYLEWLAGITHSAIAGTYDLGDLGVLGVNMIYVDYGSFQGTRRADNSAGYEDTESFSPAAYMVGVSYGRRISSRFSFGGTLKYCREDLGSAYVSTSTDSIAPATVDNILSIPAFDFGTLFYTGFHDLRLGMTLQNFSQEKEYIDESFPLPLTFRFGLAMDVLNFLDLNDGHSLTCAVELVHPRDYTERIHLGIEYWFQNVLALRSGYKSNYDLEDFSFGLGLKPNLGGLGLQFDYAYTALDNFDGIHIITLGINLDE